MIIIIAENNSSCQCQFRQFCSPRRRSHLLPLASRDRFGYPARSSVHHPNPHQLLTHWTKNVWNQSSTRFPSKVMNYSWGKKCGARGLRRNASLTIVSLLSVGPNQWQPHFQRFNRLKNGLLRFLLSKILICSV